MFIVIDSISCPSALTSRDLSQLISYDKVSIKQEVGNSYQDCALLYWLFDMLIEKESGSCPQFVF